jgi:hypothetical protein
LASAGQVSSFVKERQVHVVDDSFAKCHSGTKVTHTTPLILSLLDFIHFVHVVAMYEQRRAKRFLLLRPDFTPLILVRASLTG